MKYMGSKNRIAKYILPIVLKDRKEGQWYVEPFVGGANMIDKVDGNRIGADLNWYLIEALNFIKNNVNSIPVDDKQFTEQMYKELKNNKQSFNPGIVGYAGFALSYAGKWFGGWCRDSAGMRDYVAESYRNAIKQSPKLDGITFVSSPYMELNVPSDSIIYCDPPYQGTTKYTKNEIPFDHDEFWKWCRGMSKKGHSVFISEYNAPDDFECIWEKGVNSSLAKDTGSKKSVEKLFKYKGE